MTQPRLTSMPLEMAVSGKVPSDMREQLVDAGWRLRGGGDGRFISTVQLGELGVC